MSIECVETLITPELAQSWIDATGDRNYRVPNERRVRLLMDELKAGRWQLNGETIKRCNGVVVDGLHRLTAISRSGIAARSLVVTGLDESVMLSVDRGRPRLFGQELAYRKVSRPSETASVSRSLRQLRAGYWSTPKRAVASDAEELAFFLENRLEIQDGIAVAYTECNSFSARKFLKCSVLVPVIVEGSRQIGLPSECETVQAFCRILATGESSQVHGCPAVALRNRLIVEKTSRRKTEPILLSAMVIHAWNRFSEGELLGSKGLVYRLSGPSAQEFPSVVAVKE